jgi:membrane protease YdiL (CAAX protease family)
LDRRSRVLAELALALAALALTELVLGALMSVGILPPMDTAHGWAWLLYGPARTGCAALLYARVASWLEPVAEGATSGRAVDTRRAQVSPLVAVAAGSAAAILGSLVIGAVLELVGLTVEEQGPFQSLAERLRSEGVWQPQGVALAVSALVAAPLCEEWFFRGLLLRRLQSVLGGTVGTRLAVVVAAAAFASLHPNPSGLATYFWLGLCFGATLHACGRLWPAMAVHAANNTVALAVLLYG